MSPIPILVFDVDDFHLEHIRHFWTVPDGWECPHVDGCPCD